MKLAKIASSRSTCNRKHVGAIIVKENTILSTGYNGSIKGSPHCDEIGHLMVHDHCVRTVHAEAYAIVQAAKNGVSVDKPTIYTTSSPCSGCFNLIVNSGIIEIKYGEVYRELPLVNATGVILSGPIIAV